MSANKYDYEVTDIEALEKFAPNAVMTVKKVLRGQVTKMLDCGVDLALHGIKLRGASEIVDIPKPEYKKKPAFLQNASNED